MYLQHLSGQEKNVAITYSGSIYLQYIYGSFIQACLSQQLQSGFQLSNAVFTSYLDNLAFRNVQESFCFYDSHLKLSQTNRLVHYKVAVNRLKNLKRPVRHDVFDDVCTYPTSDDLSSFFVRHKSPEVLYIYIFYMFNELHGAKRCFPSRINKIKYET